MASVDGMGAGGEGRSSPGRAATVPAFPAPPLISLDPASVQSARDPDEPLGLRPEHRRHTSEALRGRSAGSHFPLPAAGCARGQLGGGGKRVRLADIGRVFSAFLQSSKSEEDGRRASSASTADEVGPRLPAPDACALSKLGAGARWTTASWTWRRRPGRRS